MDYLVKIRSVQTPLNGQFSIGANTVVRNDVLNNTVPFRNALDVISRTMRNVGSATPKTSTGFIFSLKDYECRKCRGSDRRQMLVEFSKRSIPVPVWLEPCACESVIVVGQAPIWLRLPGCGPFAKNGIHMFEDRFHITSLSEENRWMTGGVERPNVEITGRGAKNED